MIRFLIKLYTVLLTIDAILSFFPETNRYPWRQKLKKVCDVACSPVRKRLPPSLPFDFSPIIVIFLSYVFIEVFSYLW
ncbi:MAG: YggT family protein [Bdellovibrionales bacterium]|nr:YggT family protein [Bdellovibrionales bacterium]